MSDNRTLREELDAISEERLKAALKASRGSVTTTAEILGVSRPTVYAMMRRYNIPVERMGT